MQSGTELSDVIPEQIIPSVVKTAPHFAGRAAWENDLNALFERFCDAMKSRLFPLLRAFSYEPWIIQLIARHCDLQEFCESIDLTTPQTYRGAYDLVTRIIGLKLIPISFTQPVVELFEKLIRRFARARPVAILEKALDAASKEVDLANIVKAMICTIETGGNWTDPLDALVAACEVDEGIRIELELNPPICKLIATGVDAQQQNVVRFIIAAAPRLRRVSFSESVSALLTGIKSGAIGCRSSASASFRPSSTSRSWRPSSTSSPEMKTSHISCSMHSWRISRSRHPQSFCLSERSSTTASANISATMTPSSGSCPFSSSRNSRQRYPENSPHR